jgi:predicted nuclease with TOPRIM domain
LKKLHETVAQLSTENQSLLHRLACTQSVLSDADRRHAELERESAQLTAENKRLTANNACMEQRQQTLGEALQAAQVGEQNALAELADARSSLLAVENQCFDLTALVTVGFAVRM